MQAIAGCFASVFTGVFASVWSVGHCGKSIFTSVSRVEV